MTQQRVKFLATSLEYGADSIILRVEAARLLRDVADALESLVGADCSYHGGEIRIPTPSHAEALRRVYKARRLLDL